MRQAGGKASDVTRRKLDILPENLHQRTPFFTGPSSMVEKLEECIRKVSYKPLTGNRSDHSGRVFWIYDAIYSIVILHKYAISDLEMKIINAK